LSSAASPNTPDSSSEVWTGRVLTAISLVALTAAHLLVRFVRLSAWRDTLGSRRVHDRTPLTSPSDDDLRSALRIGDHIDRATWRLPFETRCLPRAVAAQWLLGTRAITSTLVLATHKTDRAGEHAFHAWVEIGETFVIGHCDRDAYRVIMAIDRTGASAADV